MILSEQTFIELAGKQEVLDAKIKAANNVTELPLKRIELYYLIELAECLNELKGEFKHWSNKPMNREAFLEELVDALHFYLSYVNHKLKDNHGLWEFTHETVYSDLVEEFNLFFEASANMGSHYEVSVWLLAWETIRAGNINETFAGLLHLAEHLGFTEQDIIDTYNRKNAVNHDRSDSGVY